MEIQYFQLSCGRLSLFKKTGSLTSMKSKTFCSGRVLKYTLVMCSAVTQRCTRNHISLIYLKAVLIIEIEYKCNSEIIGTL